MRPRSIYALHALVLSLFLYGALPFAGSEQVVPDARMDWWREARFGLFIHWGLYAIPGGVYEGQAFPRMGEWLKLDARIPVDEYAQYADAFNPTAFDADTWVDLAQRAGAKYIIFTAKHHDGFAMFDSEASRFNVVDATPFKRDVLKEIADACRARGMKLGFYYSHAQDWHHPGGAVAEGEPWDTAQAGNMDDYLDQIAVPQVRELLSNYGDVAVLWWDTPIDMTRERADKLLPLLALQPDIITNDRLLYGTDEPRYRGDFKTPEQLIPPGQTATDWEACITMNDTWGYKRHDDNWKPPDLLIRTLARAAAKGGNLLLNIGPTAEGTIPQPSVERLEAIGAWMRANGASIYGTSGSPFVWLPWGVCTRKEGPDVTRLYLHVFDWPASGTLSVPGLRNAIKRAYLLADGAPLRTHRDDHDVVIAVPAEPVHPADTVVVLEVTEPLLITPNNLAQDAEGVIRLPARRALLYNRSYGEHAELQGEGEMSYIGNWSDPNAWLAWPFRVEKPGAFDVYMTAASNTDTNYAILRVDRDSTPVKVVHTGGLETFTRAKVGSVELTSTGEMGLSLRPFARGWRGFRLRAVELIPVPEGAESGREGVTP